MFSKEHVPITWTNGEGVGFSIVPLVLFFLIEHQVYDFGLREELD